ncbi:MAG: hypothetical protein IT204_00390 [Fimbriimonadaceae bacterium]|nr:hypothetical protein [Fimbriimonadaceae bacterium]
MTFADPPAESRVVCEGYHDRAMWAGALQHLGCLDIRGRGGRDPWGRPVAGQGDYGFVTPTGRFVRLRPVHGGPAQLRRHVLSSLALSQTAPVSRLVVQTDADCDTALGPDQVPQLTLGTVSRWLTDAAVPHRTAADGSLLLASGTPIHLLHWRVDAPPRPGVPAKQTLERVLCSALAAVAPDCADAVEAWLASRPDGLPIPVNAAAQAKAPALSYLAGWFADGGSEGFAQRLWAHRAVRAELIGSLETTGVWSILQQVAA